MKKKISSVFILIMVCALLLFGCSVPDFDEAYSDQRGLTESFLKETDSGNDSEEIEPSDAPAITESEPFEETSSHSDDTTKETTSQEIVSEETATQETTAEDSQTTAFEETVLSFEMSMVPAYSGCPYVEINGNTPFFTKSELTEISFEKYSELDHLGRCGVAFACIGTDIMPTEERGEIGSVRPSGWHTVKYPVIPDRYLYNRCHLIGYQLAGENANVKNLITGTRYLNVQGMLPFENQVTDYVTRTNNHVLYRVTPIFEGENLVASGVLMEAESVEDGGSGILFNVYCYNVQPGVIIDYSNGESYMEDSETTTESAAGIMQPAIEPDTKESAENESSMQYILNTNTKKFHKPECSSVQDMKEKNKKEFFGTRSELIDQGYSPCKRCNP